IGPSIVLLAQSNSILAPLSVTSRRICCPPHMPFANLFFLSTAALLTAASLLRQEAPSPRNVKSKQTASDGNIRFSVLIDSLQSDSVGASFRGRPVFRPIRVCREKGSSP